MKRETELETNTQHSQEISQVYQRLLADTSLRARFIELEDGRQAHIVEKGSGTPLVLLHGSGNSALFLLPLLKQLDGLRTIAVDRPGCGLSDPTELPQDGYREAAVAWMERLLAALDLDRIVLLGHSMGGLWSVWYALAHPEQVRQLVLLGGTPLLPETRSPLPFRLMATPILGDMLQRRPSDSDDVLQFARLVGEGDTLVKYPHLVDLMVAEDRDPVAAATLMNEIRTILSPLSLINSSWWRSEMQVQEAELEKLEMPTLMIWGDHEPVGSVQVAERLTKLMPQARLEVLSAGHGPWLGNPERCAALVEDLVRQAD